MRCCARSSRCSGVIIPSIISADGPRRRTWSASESLRQELRCWSCCRGQGWKMGDRRWEMAVESELHSSPFAPLLLTGPTAVGKSEIALRLAEKLGGEIVSVDSMQVYRGLDIGTAKPSAADRARVPHHLIDIVEITELFD